MRLGIDIIFRMKTIGTNKGTNDVWIYILSKIIKKSVVVIELPKNDWYSYLHQMKSIKEVASVSEDNLV